MDNLKEIIKLQDQYIKLLTDEINDMVGIAHTHGWESSRYEVGLNLRNEISRLKSANLESIYSSLI